MAYIGKSPSQGVRNKYVYNATANQQAFTGADTSGFVLSVSDKLYTDVFHNGVMLKSGTDYSVTPTTVTLVAGALVDDVIEIITYDIGSVEDAVSASSGGTFNGPVYINGKVAIENTSIAGGSQWADDLVIGDGSQYHGITLYTASANGQGSIYFSDGTSGASQYAGYIVYDHATDALFTYTATNKWTKQDSSGNFEIKYGNLVMTTAGKGIDFSATSDATSTAGGTYVTESEVLDDYEEGRFTPAFHATNVTWTHNHQYGNYTKVGEMVHFSIYIAVTSATGSTGNQAYVWGLPYTCYNGTSSGRYSPAVAIGSWYNGGLVSSTIAPVAYIDPNSDIIKLVFPKDGAVPDPVLCNDVKNNTFIYLSGSYKVA